MANQLPPHFGGPCQIPGCQHCPPNQPHVPLVSYNSGHVHADNPGSHSFTGLGCGVAYASQVPVGTMRHLTGAANWDMRAGLGGLQQHHRPGAMGAMQAPGVLMGENGERRGHQLYVGSSVRGPFPPPQGDWHLTMAPSVEQHMPHNAQGNLRMHNSRYRCSEQNNLCEHGYANAGVAIGGNGDIWHQGPKQFYVQTAAHVNPNTPHLAPCGRHNVDVGCEDCLPGFNGTDIGQGP